MSSFKKMKLIPFDDQDNITSQNSKIKMKTSEKCEDRLINIINSNLDAHTKLDILKKNFEESLEVYNSLPKEVNKTTKISRKILSPPTKKRKKNKLQITKKLIESNDEENPDIPWKTFGTY